MSSFEHPFKQKPVVPPEFAEQPSDVFDEDLNLQPEKLTVLPEDSERFVIRKYSPSFHHRSLEEAIELHKKVKVVFEKLQSDGVTIPSFQTIVGGDGAEVVIYTIVDRVVGEDLPSLNLDVVDEHFLLEAEKTIRALLKNCETAWQENGPVLLDVPGLVQFVYGKASRDEDNHLYMVDLDPVSLYPAQFRKADGWALGKQNSTAAREFLSGVQEILMDLNQKTDYQLPEDLEDELARLEKLTQ